MGLMNDIFCNTVQNVEQIITLSLITRFQWAVNIREGNFVLEKLYDKLWGSTNKRDSMNFHILRFARYRETQDGDVKLHLTLS